MTRRENSRAKDDTGPSVTAAVNTELAAADATTWTDTASGVPITVALVRVGEVAAGAVGVSVTEDSSGRVEVEVTPLLLLLLLEETGEAVG